MGYKDTVIQRSLKKGEKCYYCNLRSIKRLKHLPENPLALVITRIKRITRNISTNIHFSIEHSMLFFFIYLAARRRFAMLRISDNGPGWK